MPVLPLFLGGAPVDPDALIASPPLVLTGTSTMTGTLGTGPLALIASPPLVLTGTSTMVGDITPVTPPPDIGHRTVSAQLLDYDGSLIGDGSELANGFAIDFYD